MTSFRTKSIFLMTVIATVMGGFADDSIPYFPTDISHTATGHISYWALLIGLTLASISLHIDTLSWNLNDRKWVLGVSLGLFTIGLFDTRENFFMHFVGVQLLLWSTVGFVLHRVYRRKGALLDENVLLLLFCGAVWFIRIPIQFVFGTIVDQQLDLRLWSTWEYLVFEWPSIIEHIKHIKFTGEVSNTYALWGFRLAGFMQWVVFLMMSGLFTEDENKKKLK